MQNPVKYLRLSYREAFSVTIVLATLPYVAWFSVVLVAFITLRKGYRAGSVLLSAILVLEYIRYFDSPAQWLNMALAFIPCFLLACILRCTVSWRSVAVVMFMQIFIAMLFVHFFVPEHIINLQQYAKHLLNHLQLDGSVIDILKEAYNVNPDIIANYLLGIQAVSVAFSAFLALVLARALQAKLYYPGGFKKEVLSFRGDKIVVFLMLITILAALHENRLAINLIPSFMFYSLLLGLSVGYSAIAHCKPAMIVLLLIMPIILFPSIMFSLYIVLGTLDSFFNFRLYLPLQADKKI